MPALALVLVLAMAVRRVVVVHGARAFDGAAQAQAVRVLHPQPLRLGLGPALPQAQV